MRGLLCLLLAIPLACGCTTKTADDQSSVDAEDDGGSGEDDELLSIDPDDGSEDGGSGDGGDGGGDDGDGDDGGGDDGGGSSVESGVLPAPPSQAGVVYVGDYIDSILRWYDITGDAPQVGGEMDMGNPVHDLAVDSINHLLAAALDVGRKVVLLSLADPASGLTAPTILSEVLFEEPPYLVQLDPYNDRLYVHTVVTGAGTVHIVDIADPSAPEVLSSISSPIFGSWSLDATRQILFLANYSAQTLDIYDVGNDALDPVPGSPIALRSDYPQENSWAFQAYAVTADPWSSRVFAGRAQGNLSELIAYEYDDFVPGEGTSYSDGATAETMVSLPDAIDLEEELADRYVSLLMAYTPLPDRFTEQVFLVGGAYDVTSMTGGILSLDSDLQAGGECDYEDGPFCWYRYWSDSEPQWSLQTDGAACLDANRGIVVGSSITDEGEGSGTMQFFQYDSDGNLSPWLSDEGRQLTNGPLAVSMACH